jgi:hypothetical protein
MQHKAKNKKGHVTVLSLPSAFCWGTQQRIKKATSPTLFAECLTLGYMAKNKKGHVTHSLRRVPDPGIHSKELFAVCLFLGYMAKPPLYEPNTDTYNNAHI